MRPLDLSNVYIERFQWKPTSFPQVGIGRDSQFIALLHHDLTRLPHTYLRSNPLVDTAYTSGR